MGQSYNLADDGVITQADYFNRIAKCIGAKPVSRKVPYSVAFGAAFRTGYDFCGEQRAFSAEYMRQNLPVLVHHLNDVALFLVFFIATGLSITLGMVMALMGGCWYPLELFPAFAQNLVKLLPTTWAMQGLLDLVLRGQGVSAILPAAGVLLGFAAVFFAIGILRFRYE